ncbi:peptidoglycan-binding domain-containing protein [Kribbella sp. CA-293567]|uniref:peptidoglycan-binding domain-containing protein n=1 Tax=Kribbella sp. CA-293567 TaxID=3002436 RepID=UPI0022DE84B8|nr:peptidoglycan-binding protein [Kribbella sp. CA-293567]WBQ03633.1 peptidoglycan-binding domain-containing protein [Kribbella sp. CA-293567]
MQIRKRSRRVAAAIAFTVATAGLTVTAAAPAAADGSYSGRPTIWGSGLLAGDWEDEGVINVRTHRNSDVTCLWQKILVADGYLPWTEKDGIFGDDTHAATVRWQRDRGLTPDGSAGRATWAKADDRIRENGMDGSYRIGYYEGSRSYFPIRRTASGVHQFWDHADGPLRTASYNVRTCR